MAHQYHALLIVKTKYENRNRFMGHPYQYVNSFRESGNQVFMKYKHYE